MSAVDTDDSWYQRMAERTAARQLASNADVCESTLTTRMRQEAWARQRREWPVPPEIQRGASGRDAFLWYIVHGWQKIFSGEEPVEVLFDHDFGCHVLRKGVWQLTLTNIEQFPEDDFRKQLSEPDHGSAASGQ